MMHRILLLVVVIVEGVTKSIIEGNIEVITASIHALLLLESEIIISV